MRRLPKKRDILQRAKETSTTRAVIHGLPSLTPTEAELKESGAYHKARIDLMRSPQTEIMLQQRRYLDQMAAEMRLTIIPKREHREQQRKVQAFDVFRTKHPSRVVRVNGYKITVPTSPMPKRVKPKPRRPRPIIPKVKAKPKKRKKRTNRTSKTMQSLKGVKGVKVFSFPDDIWKVRKRKRRR